MQHTKHPGGSPRPTDDPRQRASTSDLFRMSPEEGGQQPPVSGHVSGSHAEQEIREHPQNLGEELKAEGPAVADEGRTMARDLGHDVRDVAEGYLGVAADQLDGIARALEAASSELRNQGQTTLAEQVDEVCNGIDRFCLRLSSNDLDAITDEARSWARHNPTAFLGGSVAVGFALSRLFKASGTGAPKESEHQAAGEPDVQLGDEGVRPARPYGQADVDIESSTHDPQRS